MLFMAPSTARSLIFTATSVALSLASACNDADPLPVYFDLNYQVGCLRPDCSGLHDPERIVKAVDGEDGYVNSCSARGVPGAPGVTVVSLSSRKGTQQTFEINSAQIGVAGDVGPSCRVKIVEGNNTYEGPCSTSPPSSSSPCQLTDFGINTMGLLHGSLYCDNIPVGSSPGITRDIARAGTHGSLPAQPAEFLVDPCEGL